MRNFYWHRPVDKMPLRGDGEASIMPPNGYEERPPFGKGGCDWFGCRWIVEEGQSPAPDCREIVLDDICDWREKVAFPDLDAWDWGRAVERDKVADIDRENNIVNAVVFHGLWERLFLLMGFEGALCALVEEPEETAAFFDAMVDFKIKLIGKLAEHYRPDAITFHDDWGTQTGTFFSPQLWRELVKPRQKRIIEATHSHGIAFIQHSCGKIDALIPDIAEIGADTLECMDINDIDAALKATGDRMSYVVNPHVQDFKTADMNGTLTPEHVRAVIHEEFMRFGASGHYTPFMSSRSGWYGDIIREEFFACRDALAEKGAGE